MQRRDWRKVSLDMREPVKRLRCKGGRGWAEPPWWTEAGGTLGDMRGRCQRWLWPEGLTHLAQTGEEKEFHERWAAAARKGNLGKCRIVVSTGTKYGKSQRARKMRLAVCPLDLATGRYRKPQQEQFGSGTRAKDKCKWMYGSQWLARSVDKGRQPALVLSLAESRGEMG